MCVRRERGRESRESKGERTRQLEGTRTRGARPWHDERVAVARMQAVLLWKVGEEAAASVEGRAGSTCSVGSPHLAPLRRSARWRRRARRAAWDPRYAAPRRSARRQPPRTASRLVLGRGYFPPRGRARHAGRVARGALPPRRGCAWATCTPGAGPRPGQAAARGSVSLP